MEPGPHRVKTCKGDLPPQMAMFQPRLGGAEAVMVMVMVCPFGLWGIGPGLLCPKKYPVPRLGSLARG